MKHFWMMLLVAGVMAGFPAVSHACKQKLEPDRQTVKLGDKVQIKATIQWIHDKCLLDIDDVNYDFKNLVKVSQTQWKKVGKGKYESTITVKITGKNAVFKMWRKCARAGKHGAEVKFQDAAP